MSDCDIENVGYTARHHTRSSEMLENWSIGDYFKKRGYCLGLEFLTSERWLEFEADKLLRYLPSEDKGNATEIWKQQPGFADHLVAVADSFWDIGLAHVVGYGDFLRSWPNFSSERP